MRHRWRDGTTHVAFEPLELLARLAALVPPPRFNLVRYHGVLAPAARNRSAVVTRIAEASPELRPAHRGCRPLWQTAPQAHASDPPSRPGPRRPRPRNYSWAELMRRVFEVDVLECPACRGRMRVLAAIHPPEVTRAILECLGLPTRAPPLSPAAVPAVATDPELDF